MPSINCGICSKFIGADDLHRLCTVSSHAFHVGCVLKRLGIASVSEVPRGPSNCFSCAKSKSKLLPGKSLSQPNVSLAPSAPPSPSSGSNASLPDQIKSLAALLTAMSKKVDTMDSVLRDLQPFKAQLAGVGDLARDLRDCLSKLTDLTSKFAGVEESLLRLSESNERLTLRVQDNEKNLSALKTSCLSRFTALEKTVARAPPPESDPSAAVQPLVARIRQLELGTQAAALTISGIPELGGLDDLKIITALFASLGSEATRSHIVEASRMRTTKTTDKPRTLLVRLCSSAIRNSVLRAKRTHGAVQATALDPRFPCTNVYVNEFLPPEVHKLLQTTRLAAKERGYRFVWVRNGVVNARKNRETAPFAILTASDVDSKMI